MEQRARWGARRAPTGEQITSWCTSLNEQEVQARIMLCLQARTLREGRNLHTRAAEEATSLKLLPKLGTISPEQAHHRTRRVMPKAINLEQHCYKRPAPSDTSVTIF